MKYDAFISYSHSADGRLGPAVQSGLQRLARPWYRRRALRVFRDETGLAVNPHLWNSIADAMDESRYFVLLASPDAASSPWVNREIEHWLETNRPDTLLPVLTEGTLGWSDELGDFDPDQSSALPTAFTGLFVDEPRHLDMRWARNEEQLDVRHSRFRAQIATLAAPIHGIAREDLEGEDIRLHLRALRLAWTGGIALALLMVAAFVAAGFAVSNAAAADEQRHHAVVLGTRATRNAALAKTQQDRARKSAGEAIAQSERATESESRATRSAAAARFSELLANHRAEDARASQGRALDSAAIAAASEARANMSAAEARASGIQASENATRATASEGRALDSAAAAHASEARANRSAAEARANASKADRANVRLTCANTELRRGIERLRAVLTDARSADVVALREAPPPPLPGAPPPVADPDAELRRQVQGLNRLLRRIRDLVEVAAVSSPCGVAVPAQPAVSDRPLAAKDSEAASPLPLPAPAPAPAPRPLAAPAAGQ